jgi:hypothetical protein
MPYNPAFDPRNYSGVAQAPKGFRPETPEAANQGTPLPGAATTPDYAAEPLPVRWTASPASGETPAAQAFAELLQGAKAHREFVSQMETQQHNYTQQGYAEQLHNFTTSQAGQAPDRAEAISAQQVSDAKAAYQAKLDERSAPGDAASEQRNTRATVRLDRVLGQAENKGQAARAFIQEAVKDGTIGAVLAEMPSHGIDPGVVDAALKEADSELAELAEDVRFAEREDAVTRENARRLRQSFVEGHRLRVPLVDPADCGLRRRQV